MQKTTGLNCEIHRLLWIVRFFVCSISYAQTNNQVLLNYPPDGTQLSTYLPNFVWNSSLVGDLHVSYNIHIAHLDSLQSYQDAIMYNPPLVYQQDILATTFPYPLSAFPLADSNKYVWQIETAVNGNIVSYSEIWMFYYQSNKRIQADSAPPVSFVYPNLQRKLNASFYIFKDKITFKYNNESGDSSLQVQIHLLGSLDTVRGVIPNPSVLKPFDNYITIPVTGAFEKQKPYALEVRNSRNELWQMKFIIKK